MPTAVGDFGLVVFGVWCLVFGCLALECAIYPVYRVSLIVIWRCDLTILVFFWGGGPHDFDLVTSRFEKRRRKTES